MSRRRRLPTAVLILGLLALAACGTTTTGADRAADGGTAEVEKLRFGIGPYQPTAEDTKAAFEPFFAYLAGELGVDYELDVTTDFVGIGVALANEQVDLAWMGPFGLVLSQKESDTEAIATVNYDGKPVYHAIVVAAPDSPVQNWPDDAEGRSISFADVGSTSGWLVPTKFLKDRGIDPTTYFDYREGATHAANETAVANGQVELATDYDRNRTAMIESGAIAPDATKVVWESDPLPNDAIGVREGFDPELAQRIQDILVGISPELAEEILPEHYTGFVAADNDSYESIRQAAEDLGTLE
ncbi:MAG TPA: phosphate/phosphite/phosphonate ABC transporter substrate-binding protein [Acidimicrobiales bacterium]|nr:phosphate/phosphite/phosphonate ABC transporter substrate-binding protein [Acidimicrobiales bacterium]